MRSRAASGPAASRRRAAGGGRAPRRRGTRDSGRSAGSAGRPRGKGARSSARPAPRGSAGAVTLRRAAQVGFSVSKIDSPDKVTGRALYVDDLRIPGMLHGRTVRSTIPRGRIVRVELDPAFDWKGVTVADHRDIPGDNMVALIEDDQPLLAAGEIRHAEEPVLLVAHEDPERAEAATRAVRIVCEPLEPVLTMEESLARKALLYGDDNVFKEIEIARGDLIAGFADADRVVAGEYFCGHQEQLYIENNGMIAERVQDGIFVRGSLQCPYYVHKALARILGLPAEKVRVAQTVTGGGFGGKEEYPSMIGGHAALLAWKSGRPVKIMYDRLEDIAATTKRHPARVRVRAGAKRDGTLTALEVEIVMDGGAYVTLSPVVLSRGAIHAGGPYRCPSVRIHARAVATSTPPNGAFRGFGAPQTQFAIECHMDRIAEELGLDPLALRRANAYRVGDVTPTGQVLRESVGAHEALEAAVKRSDYAARRARCAAENARAAEREAAEDARATAGAAASARAGRAGAGAGRPGRMGAARASAGDGNGRARAGAPRMPGSLAADPGALAPGRRVRRGVGLSLVFHGAGFTGSGEVKLASVAALDLTPEGRPRILSANTEIGQGTVTVFCQVVAEALGVPVEFVAFETPDTGAVPDSGPTVASRTLMVVGGLLEQCALEMRGKLELFAERPARDARDFARVARRWLAERGALRIERRYQKPPGLQWSDADYRGDAYGVFSYGCCVVEVEVDLETCETRVLHAVASADIGRAIHPVLAAGQIEGGTVQGLGWALLEDVRWKDGRVWNHQLTNYIIPTSADSPPIEVEIVEVPYSHGPHGAKGVGELPMDAPAPAVVNAIAHATGARVSEIPVLPERLMRALRSQERT